MERKLAFTFAIQLDARRWRLQPKYESEKWTVHDDFYFDKVDKFEHEMEAWEKVQPSDKAVLTHIFDNLNKNHRAYWWSKTGIAKSIRYRRHTVAIAIHKLEEMEFIEKTEISKRKFVYYITRMAAPLVHEYWDSKNIPIRNEALHFRLMKQSERNRKRNGNERSV